MLLKVQMPDGTTADVTVADETYARARAAWEARGLTFEAAFNQYLQDVLEAQQREADQRETQALDPRR